MCELGGAGAGNTASMLHRDADLTSPHLGSLKTIFRIAHSFLCCLVTVWTCTVLPKMWLQGSPVPVQ